MRNFVKIKNQICEFSSKSLGIWFERFWFDDWSPKSAQVQKSLKIDFYWRRHDKRVSIPRTSGLRPKLIILKQSKIKVEINLGVLI